MRRTPFQFAALVLVAMWARAASAQITPAAGFTPPDDTPKVAVGGTIFTNYTYTDEPTTTDADKNTIHPNSFEVQRAYINVTGNISHLVSFRITPDISGRFSTSVSSKSTVTDGAAGESVTTTTTGSTSYDGSLVFRLKYAFGQLNLDEWTTHGTWVRIGQQQTPLIDFYEGIYRYRFQGTTFAEREGFLSSADVGISGRYAFPNDYGDIHFGYYNGDTYSKAEANDQKAWQGRLSIRPLPKDSALKGLRLTGFFDADHYIQNDSRNRFFATMTFEHKYVNAGVDYSSTKDKPTAAAAQVQSNGYSFWVTPRTTVGLEGFFRYDSTKPNKDVDARKKRTIFGVAYWFKTQKAPVAAALLADYERVTYDAQPSGTTANPIIGLGKPRETRYALHALLNF